jgi:hypothetical protein
VAKGYKQSKASAVATVKRWRREPERSGAARIGTRLLAGEVLGMSGADDAGVSPGMVGQVVRTLQIAGYRVEAERHGNAKLWKVRPEEEAEHTRPRRARVAREVVGETYPHLGASLTVRALVLDSDGHLAMQLSDGNGSAWSVRVTGHVGS